jgi:hypothetical protein
MTSSSRAAIDITTRTDRRHAAEESVRFLRLPRPVCTGIYDDRQVDDTGTRDDTGTQDGTKVRKT